MKKKKVLFVINTLGRAGAENALIALMNKFDKTKYDLYLYVLMNQGEVVHDLPEGVRLLNRNYCDKSVLSKEGKKYLVKNTFLACLRNGAIFKNVGYLAENVADCVKNKRRLLLDKLLWKVMSDGGHKLRQEYDLAVAYIEGGSAYYVHDHVRARKKAGFVHVDYTEAGYNRKLDRNIYLDFDRVFTVSDEVKESVYKVYPEIKEKVEVFHNLVDDEKVKRRSESEPEGMAEDDYYSLVTLGRLVYAKGYDVAIDAMKILKDRGVKARWYVLGEGPDKEALTKQIKDNGLENEFILMGAKDNPYPYIRRATIYVHATRYEGKSIAIQEAQILGKPIIVSDCSGNREQVVDGFDGMLCDFDAGAIADAIENMLNNPEKREEYGKQAAQKKINHIEELKYLYDLLQ